MNLFPPLILISVFYIALYEIPTVTNCFGLTIRVSVVIVRVTYNENSFTIISLSFIFLLVYF